MHPLLQSELPQLSQPFLIEKLFQLSITYVALLFIHSNKSISFSYWGNQNWAQDFRWGLIRAKEEGPPSPSCPWCFWYSPGYFWLSWQWAHPAEPWTDFHPLAPSSSQQGCSPSLHPPACTEGYQAGVWRLLWWTWTASRNEHACLFQLFILVHFSCYS